MKTTRVSILLAAATCLAAQSFEADKLNVDEESAASSSAAPLARPIPINLERLRAPDSLRPFHYSLYAFAAANTLDAASSMGKYELNPILGRGAFGGRQLATKSVIAGAVVIGELLIVRKYTKAAKILSWTNFGESAIIGGVAVRNWRVR